MIAKRMVTMEKMLSLVDEIYENDGISWGKADEAIFDAIRAALIERDKLKKAVAEWKKELNKTNRQMSTWDRLVIKGGVEQSIRNFKLDGEEEPVPPAKGGQDED